MYVNVKDNKHPAVSEMMVCIMNQGPKKEFMVPCLQRLNIYRNQNLSSHAVNHNLPHENDHAGVPPTLGTDEPSKIPWLAG